MGTYIKIVGGKPILFDDEKGRHKFLLKNDQVFSTLDRLLDAIEDGYRFNGWLTTEIHG